MQAQSPGTRRIHDQKYIYSQKLKKLITNHLRPATPRLISSDVALGTSIRFAVAIDPRSLVELDFACATSGEMVGAGATVGGGKSVGDGVGVVGNGAVAAAG